MKNNERVTVNFDKMLLPALKTEAKSRKVKGFSTMKKAELVAALKATEKVSKPADSYVDVIVGGIREAREARSNKGKAASRMSHSALKTQPEDKARAFRLQRGSETAKLTPKQARRVRKTENILVG